MDYDSIRKSYIGFDTEQRVILEFEADGKLIRQMMYGRENSVIKGHQIITLGYFGEGSTVVETEAGYFEFDNNWSFIGRVFLYSHIRHGQFPVSSQLRVISPKRHLVLENNVGLSPGFNYTEEYFDSARVLRLVDLNSSRSELFLNYPSQSSFRKEGQLFSKLKPIISLPEPDKALLAFGMDPKLYTIDLISRKITSVHPLDLKAFGSIKGLAFENQNTNIHPGFGLNQQLMINGYLNGSILKILSLKDFILVFYKPGISTHPPKADLDEAMEIFRQDLFPNVRIAILDKSLTPLTELNSGFTVDQVHSLFELGSNSFMIMRAKTDNEEFSTYLTYRVSFAPHR